MPEAGGGGGGGDATESPYQPSASERPTSVSDSRDLRGDPEGASEYRFESLQRIVGGSDGGGLETIDSSRSADPAGRPARGGQ